MSDAPATHPPILGDRLQRPGRLRTLALGAVRVTFVPDGHVQLPPERWFPDAPAEVWKRHADYVDRSGHLVASIGALLVEHGDDAMLIDAGVGPVSVPAQPGNAHGAIVGGALLDNLARAGRSPSEIRTIAFTHLHLDHLGWACWTEGGRHDPPLAGATYRINDAEWLQREVALRHGSTEQMLEALAPRVRTFADGDQIFPGVHAWSLPGHTPGHAGFVVEGGGRRLIAFGDAMHSPLQLRHPEWRAAADHEPEQARQYRRQLLAELSKPDTLGFGGHFADAVFGTVVAAEGGPTWRPAATA